MKAGAILVYGAGQLGLMLMVRFFFQWLIRFCDVGKETSAGPLLAAATVGMIFFAFRIFDGITDPLAGILADRWVGAGKERRALLFRSFALPALGLALVFSPNETMAPPLRYSLVTLGMLLFFLGYTFYAIPYWSLVDDYSGGDDQRRTALSNIQGVGVLLATGLGFVLSPALVENLGFFWSALIFAAVGTSLMTLPYFASPADASPSTAPLPSLRQGLADCVNHKRFLAVIVLYAGAQMSLTIMTAAAPFIAERLLGGSLKDVALLLGPFLLTAILTFSAVPRVARRLGWERATLGGTLALAIAYLGAGLLGQAWIGSKMTTAMLVFACAGPGCAFILGLEGEAIARCAQLGPSKSTSAYFGIFNFVVKALNGFALFATGILAEEGSQWSVRAMPMLAGVLCLLGVGLYLTFDKSDPEPRGATS